MAQSVELRELSRRVFNDRLAGRFDIEGHTLEVAPDRPVDRSSLNRRL
jgi:hypothetical protein